MDPNIIPRRPTAGVCPRCGEGFEVKPTGRARAFCSPKCRQASFQYKAKLSRPPKPLKPASEEQQRALMWRLLQEAGLVPVDESLPPLREDH